MYSDGSCDVHIKVDDVAPFHCKLERMEDGRVFVESLSKTAKTLLNGVPVTERTFVAHDSLLTVVDRNFKFLYPENSAYIFRSAHCALSGVKTGISLSPMLTSSPRCVSEVSSFPRVVSNSLKPSPLQSARVRTPTLSSQRRGLSTKERYGPTPTRPVATPPAVSIKRHSLKRRSSKTGSFSSPIRKNANVNVISNTPLASGSSSIRVLRSSTSREETLQTNNSYYSLSSNQTRQFDLFDVSAKSPNSSSTLLLSEKSRANILPIVDSAGAFEMASDAQSKSDLLASQNLTSTGRRICRSSLPRQGSPGGTAPHYLAKDTRQFDASLRVGRSSPPIVVDSDHEIAKSQSIASGDHSEEYRPVKKGVQFGPSLSPEQFDSRLPPSTPIRRGELPPSSSFQRTYASIVKNRTPTLVPPLVKDGCNVSSEQFKPHSASVKLKTKPNLRALSRNLMDSFIDDSTAALKNLANGNMDSSPVAVSKSPAFSEVASPELANTEDDQAPKPQSFALNGYNVDMDHEGMSHDASTLFTPICTGGLGSAQMVSSGRRGPVNAPSHRSAGRTPASSTGVMEAKPGGRRGRSLPASRLNSPLSSTSRSRNASNSRLSFSDASVALQPSVSRLNTENESLANLSTVEARFERTGAATIPSRAGSLNRRSMDALKMHSSSKLPSTRRPTRLSGTASSPTLSDTQETVNVPAFSDSTINSVQLSKAKLKPELRKPTVLSSVRSNVYKPEARDASRLSGIQELTKSPRSTLSQRLSGVGKPEKPRRVTASSVLSGTGELVATPKSVRSSRVSVVGKLVKTPSIQVSSDMGAIQELTESSEIVLSSSLSGAKKFLKTPVDQASAQLSDIGELMITPKSVLSPRLLGAGNLVKTPKVHPPKFSGARKLVKTPKSLPSPRLSGVRRLIKTPKVQSSPQLSDIRELIKTPKPLPSPRLSGVRRLVKTPKAQASPRLSGIRKLVKTPKPLPSPRLSGVRRLVKTPKVQVSPPLSGIRKLMKTPESQPSPRLRGVRRIMRTPKAQASPELSGIRELVKTPKSVLSPRLSGVKELMETPELWVSPNLPEICRSKNVPRSLSSLKIFGLEDIVETPSELDSKITSQKSITSRSKRSKTPQLSSPGKRRRLQKSKDADVPRALPSDLSEVRQTRSRAKVSTTAPHASIAEVVVSLDVEAEKVQRRKCGGHTKPVFAASVESSASRAVKKRRKQLSPVAEPSSPIVRKIVQQESVKVGGARGAKSKSTKGAKCTLSLQRSAFKSPVLSLDSQSENEGKDSVSRKLRPKRFGNRRTGASPLGTIDSPPPSPSTDQKIKPKASTVTRTPAGRRKRPTPKSTPARRSRRAVQRGVQVSSPVQRRQVNVRRKVQFSDPEAIDIGADASTVDVNEVIGSVATSAARRKRGISQMAASPNCGCVLRQTRQKSAALTTSLRRKVPASPILRPMRRGRAKK
ncbi:hypothetical protein TcWFU_004223 [Taenia crassiceps]|uniref:Antigen KI-67 n=1 Tax=Taenia crassiceps TaxID=6207 RepID=A0ABR4QQT4_9CEST